MSGVVLLFPSVFQVQKLLGDTPFTPTLVMGEMTDVEPAGEFPTDLELRCRYLAWLHREAELLSRDLIPLGRAATVLTAAGVTIGHRPQTLLS